MEKMNTIDPTNSCAVFGNHFWYVENIIKIDEGEIRSRAILVRLASLTNSELLSAREYYVTLSRNTLYHICSQDQLKNLMKAINNINSKQ